MYKSIDYIAAYLMLLELKKKKKNKKKNASRH